MSMIVHNLKVAVRNLMKYKLQVTISVLSIAIGIVTLALVHSFTASFVLPNIYSRPYYDRTYFLRLEKSGAQTETDFTGRNISATLEFSTDIIRAIKRDGGLKTAEIIAMPCGAVYNDIMEFQLCDSTKRKFEIGFSIVDPEYMPFTGLRSAITGQPVKRLKAGEAVLSKQKASLMFGGANPVGAVCHDVNDLHPMPLTIVDVFEDVSLFEDGIENSRLYFSLGEIEDAEITGDRSPYYVWKVDIVLREGCTESQLRAELDERLAPFNCHIQLKKESDHLPLTTILNIQFFAHLAGSLILLAAIIGFLRMQMQLFWMRRREVSLRMVNGAKRGQLFHLLFTEVFLVVGMSVAVAMMMGTWVEDFIYTRLSDLVHDASFCISGFTYYGLYIGALLLLVCGLSIWLTLKRICNAGQGLASHMRHSHTHLFRNAMLGIQTTICIIFVCSSLTIADWGDIIMGQYHLPDDLRPYKESIYLDLNAATTGADALKREIEHLPSLKRMVACEVCYYKICEIAESKEATAAFNGGTHKPCFEATDTSLVEFFQYKINWLNKPANVNECLILNEDFYRKLHELNLADNNVLTINNEYTLPIAGTIPNLPYDSRQASILIHPDMANGCRKFVLVPREGKYRSLVQEVDSTIRCMEPSIVEKIAQNFHESHVELMMTDTMRRVGWILAGVSIIICAMSVYSSIVLDTRSRKKEVAIRKVNGAKSGNIYSLFGRLYFILACIALVIAMPVVAAFRKLIFMDVSHIELEAAIHPVALFVTGSLIVIALIAAIVGWNIYSIMRTNPAEIIAKE